MNRIMNWAVPITIQAFIIWLVLCAILVPLALVLSHRFPHLFRRRSNPNSEGLGVKWIIALIVCAAYISGVIAFTFLPLPDPSTFSCVNANLLYYTRYYVGWSVEFAFRQTQGMGLDRFAKWWFVQIYLNVILFIPWGVLARFLFKVNFRTVLLSGFAASLMIELTQLTGIWGIYGCRYRTFDVDDILTNTLGAVLGFFAMKGLEYLRHRKAESRPLSSGRRFK